jgi:hypothetical protein
VKLLASSFNEIQLATDAFAQLWFAPDIGNIIKLVDLEASAPPTIEDPSKEDNFDEV